jgi:hypothetical protein
MPCAFQASSIARYSVILFWRFFAVGRQVLDAPTRDCDVEAIHRRLVGARCKFALRDRFALGTAIHANSSSSAFGSSRTGVPNPSVNQL